MAPSADVITISPRLAASMGAGVACALLLMLWAYRRRAFILLWAAGWALAAIALLFESPAGTTDGVSLLSLAAGGSAAIASAPAVLGGVVPFSRPPARRPPRPPLLPPLPRAAAAGRLLPSAAP